jgi:hypothetical protein
MILILKLKITIGFKMSSGTHIQKWMNKKELKFVAGAKTSNIESNFMMI